MRRVGVGVGVGGGNVGGIVGAGVAVAGGVGKGALAVAVRAAANAFPAVLSVVAKFCVNVFMVVVNARRAHSRSATIAGGIVLVAMAAAAGAVAAMAPAPCVAVGKGRVRCTSGGVTVARAGLARVTAATSGASGIWLPPFDGALPHLAKAKSCTITSNRQQSASTLL